MKQKIIFSNSYSPRTGHNFAAEVFKIFVDAEVIAHHRSETRIAPLLDVYYGIYDKHIFGKKDKEFFDHLFINDLRNKIITKSNKEFIIIKNTSFVGVEQIKRVFPNDIQILLIRDPLAVLKSGFKALKFDKKGIKYKVQKIGYHLGLYPLYYALMSTYKNLKHMPDLSNFFIIRYEDLVLKNDDELLRLKNLFDSNKSLSQIKEEIDEIEVINTSFIEETGGEKIWDSKLKTEKFDPIKRKGHNYLVRTALKMGSYKLRKKMGYI